MSMPALTPEAVITSPSSTQRSSALTSMEGSASANRPSAFQYVVAGRSRSSPALAQDQ